MNDDDRKMILKNIDALVNLTDFQKLCQACLKYNLLTNVMLHNIQQTVPSKNPLETCDDRMIRIERHKRLFIKITKRGPEAFKKLQKIFKELKYKEASKLLFGHGFTSLTLSKLKRRPVSGDNDEDDDEDEDTNGDQENVPNNDIDDRDSRENQQIPNTSNDKDKTLHEYKGEIKPTRNIEVRKATKISKHPTIPTYPMESEHHRGVLFLVNIIDFPINDEKRQGAEFDTHSMSELFKQMKFKVYVYENLTKQEFYILLDDLLKTQEIKLTECFVMALMTHGELSEGIQYIKFHDGAMENVEEIEKRFYNENCPQLLNKPKIFIFPYCRGDTKDKGVILPDKTQTESVKTNSRRSINNIEQLSDVIKCYATRVGFVSHRSTDEGSWYVQNFVDTVAEHAHDTHFEDMLKIVQSKITQMRTERNELQTASYSNIGFNKILFFNPGFSIK